VFFRKKKKIDIENQEVEVVNEPFNTYGLSDLLHFIKREIGVDLFPKKAIIETRIRLFCEEKNINSFRKLFDEIQYNKEMKQDLVNLLTVNETYFYRELIQLQEAIEFAKTREGVDVLCAPCASGEEVYTISMMLEEDHTFRKRFNIIGIDINSEAIQKAKNGIYNARSLHKLSDNLKEKYFTLVSDKYQIKKEKFLHVDFSQINVFDDKFLSFGKFDIIFSRNMLIYFDEDFRIKAMQKFSKLLKEGGRIYLGHADIVPENEYLQKHGFGSSCYYTKK
jgi:chemotaxis protein methyltransferase CheR